MDSLSGLLYGFQVALQPHNLMWSFFGVLMGNLIGVLPGLGALSAIAMLLPLTYTMHAVPALMMLAGIYYGSNYGGAIGAILLNLPSHPPHAITCLDGYPMTLQGRGAKALGITMIASAFAEFVGIVLMLIASPALVDVAFRMGPAELTAVMLLGLVAGSTMARGSPLKGVAMTTLGLLIGMVGTDPDTGTRRFTFGLIELSDRVEIVALAMGLFAVADFFLHVNHMRIVGPGTKVRLRDLAPSMAEIRQSIKPILRGTSIGALFGAMPGTGPTITTFLAYALEQKVSKTPERFGHGMIEGVASPEAAAHAKVRVDFIPTLSLGIPGDAVMALLLGAMLIQGIQPGPLLISDHPDLFWGLIASFAVGNVILLILNVPLIGLWVKLLQVPYRYLFPSALFFVAAGVYSTNNSLFEVGEVLFCGVVGGILLMLDFPVAPILLGYVLGPLIEENFRRAMLLSHGDLSIFFGSGISAGFMTVCLILLAGQIVIGVRGRLRRKTPAAVDEPVCEGP